MKKLLIVSVVILFAGCSLDKQFVTSINQYLDVILPEYKEYVKEDIDISDDTKRIRTQTADRLDSLVSNAAKEGE